MRAVRRAAAGGPGIAVFVLVLVVWEIATLGSGTPYFPPLHKILGAFADNWVFERLPTDLVPSLGRLFAGYLLGVVIGVGLGVLVGGVHRLRAAAMPYVDFMRSLPPTALVPAVIVLFGIGSSGKVVLIAFACVWPIVLNTVSALANLDTLWRETARAYRIEGPVYLRSVLVPAALPPILAGARTSLAIALIMVVVTEMVGSTDGIGHFVVQAERTFAITDMWSGVVLIGILGFLLNACFRALEARLLRGHGEREPSQR